MSAEAVAAAVEGAALDLHEGISPPGSLCAACATLDGPCAYHDPGSPSFGDPAAGGCLRWPEPLRLRSSNGELVRGRCRSTNLCGYCAKLAAVENSELLALDALAGNAPQLWAVLTTRTATIETRRFYRSREHLLRALRRRWPACEIAALVEFTTGYGPKSGGARRPHWNLLIKGVPAGAVDQARDVIVGVWCAREDAEPQGQYVGQVGDAAAVMAYVALHFQKESQAPPAGWRGHRFLKTRGYLSTSTPEARDQARRSLRFKRELWRAIRRGESAIDAEISAHRAMAIADATTWELVQPSLEVLRALDLPAGEELADQGGPESLPEAAGSSHTSTGRPDVGTDAQPVPAGAAAAQPGGPAGRSARRPPTARMDAGSAAPSARGGSLTAMAQLHGR